MWWLLEWPRSDLTLRHIREGSALGPKLEEKDFQESVLLFLTRNRVLALSCLSLMRSEMFFEIWYVLSALFFCLIASLISSFHQGTLLFLIEFEVLPIAISAALIMDSEMKLVSFSIVLVSDWVLSCISVSTRLEKNAQSAFFNFHLWEGVGDSVLVDSRDIIIGRWSLSYIS
ncbi:Uncharacterized protein FWK35_00036927 [Aphis craccivora]|uniref:Uncharacterized protein n=1 Tax=Aphis craccivora TaxID=307492 RepID=A0A6G0VPR1_APHCR|nr:Uncharacterized protein FWK35_00036927 [Aphis craccivora]